MTAFEELARGDIIWASDPLSEKGRPMLVLGTPQFPNHGVQLITVLISTKTYHEESLTLQDDDYEGDPLGERSHVLPWSLATLTSAADVDHYLTSLVDERTEDVASQLVEYITT
ncbi:type II toxin-antitoxin system PemK/MazF family toxin [Halosimplex pelagicum]|uniref:PemK-like protein n=1 Tax=Halosimplex pelagicum TaxID=869886 RepID=A0A7D5PDR9_9EURY|nr:type II toxin-antitoxin system PemK/MazF family toxin [Halosimplex pelagicum]QLH81320.1 PemK-like protein [Halosimplex pelagicum]